MKKDRRAQWITVAVLIAALGVGLARKAGWRPSDLRPSRIASGQPANAGQNPREAVYAMLDAARAGDVKRYLASYAGQMEASLRQTVAESSEPGFAKYLRDSNATLKGIAVSELQRVTDQEARVRVEYIYEDRNEAQTMNLERGPSGWKITRADRDERVKTLIPYGTLVK
jgi:hypothetical protein